MQGAGKPVTHLPSTSKSITVRAGQFFSAPGSCFHDMVARQFRDLYFDRARCRRCAAVRPVGQGRGLISVTLTQGRGERFLPRNHDRIARFGPRPDSAEVGQ